MKRRAHWLLLALACLPACHTAKLDPTSCEAHCAGCCTQAGACEPGTQGAACGVAGASCVACNASELCSTGLCVQQGPPAVDAGPAPGQSCATAEALELLPGVEAHLVVSPAGSSSAPGCGQSFEGGRWLALDVKTAAAVVIEARARDPRDVLVVSLVPSCGDASEHCTASPAGAGLAIVGALAPGRWWLQIDTRSLSAPADLAVTLAPAATTCAESVSLRLPRGDTLINVATPARSAAPACDGARRASTTLRLEPQVPEELSLVSSAALEVRAGACDGTVLGCQGPMAAAALALGRVPGGALSVTVGADGASSPQLLAHLGPATPAEGCDTVGVLDVSAGSVTVRGSTAGARDDASPSCGVRGGADRVYRIEVPQGATLAARVTALGTGYAPVVWLSEGVCDGAERACAAGRFTLGRLRAGAWFVWVDSADGSSGDFELSLDVSVGASGEVCQSPIQVPLDDADGGRLVFTGTLAGSSADEASTCGGAGPDQVFWLTPPSPFNLDATLSTTEPWWTPELHAGGCGSGLARCVVATDAGAHLRLGSFTGGPLVVDAQELVAGAWSLTVEYRPVPPGDDCANPLVVPLDGGLVRFTLPLDTLYDQLPEACGGPPTNDAVVALQPTRSGLVAATARLGDGGLAALSVQGSYQPVSSCALATVCSRDAGTLVRRVLAGDRWVLGVHGDEPVSVDAVLTPTAPGAWCADPIILPTTSTGLDGGALLVGQLLAASDGGVPRDGGGDGCMAGGVGVTYQVMVPPRARVSATVQPAAGNRVSLGSCAAWCSTSLGAPGAAATTVFYNGALVPAPTTIIVDGLPGQDTAFALTVRYAGPY